MTNLCPLFFFQLFPRRQQTGAALGQGFGCRWVMISAAGWCPPVKCLLVYKYIINTIVIYHETIQTIEFYSYL
jgi:hypothetical protein